MADYDSEIVKNPKFKAYGDDFLASLQSFDKVKEWADLIKCIQKVQKVLEKYPQFPLLPHRLVFCKRIAQCLNPALPGGVHAKAIQTLMIVYEKIGPERLSKDLGMYTMGVLALFQDASIKVKPLILSLIETHMLPLNKALIPCMTGFVISLMPGLEEEGSETYPRIQKLFDVVAKRTNPKLFFRSVWKSISMSPAARCPALNFLLSRIPVDKSNPEVIEVFLPERFTLVQSALIQALSDPNLLTQRAALELLITHFTLQSRIFNDWVPIAESALILLTHKEVSLNRRLYQWFLGAVAQQGEDSEEGAAPMSAPKVLPVYETYGKITLISALHNIFKRKATSKAESILPIQILMPLLDKPEIGESIIELVLPDAFDLLARYKEGHEFSYDVTHSVSQLFDILNPDVVFGLLRQTISEQVEKSDTTKLVQVISWIDAFVSCLPLTEIEAKARAQFVPKLLCSLINGLIFIRSQGCSELIPGLRLIKKVFGRLSNGDTSNDELVEALRAFGDLYAKIVNDRLMPSLRQSFFVDEAVRYQQLVNILVEATETLVTVYTHYTTPLHSSDPSVLPEWLSALLLPSLNASDCFAVCTTAKAFAALLSQPNFGLEASQQRHIICNTNFIPEIISKLWTFLSYDQSQFHYTIADILCVLYSTAEDKVTTILGDKLLQEELHKRFEACEKFSLIWRLTTDRPHAFKGNLLLMLDTLSDHQPMVRLAGRSWLADSLHRAERILDPLFEILMSPNTARCNYIYRAEYDTQQVLYILQTLKKVLDCDFQMFLKFAMMKSINHSLTNLNDKQYLPVSSDPSMQSVELLPIALEPNNYLELMVLISLRFMMGSCSQYVETISLADMNEGGFVARNRIVQSTAANFLNHLLLKIFDRDVAVRLACQSQELILRALGQAVLVQDLDLQVELLRLLLSVLTLRESYKSKASEFPPLCSSPLFLQTMVGGMMQPAHMNVRFYWMEFFTLGLPYFRSDMPVIVVPILRCLCTILESLDNVLGSVGAKEVLVVLRTLHDLTMMCLEEKSPPPIVAPAESSLLLLDPTRLFTNFVSAINPTPEAPTQQLSELSQAREELFRDLPFILETLLKIRADPEKATSGNPTGKVNEDEVSNRYLIENRIHTILDPIMANFPQEMVAGLCTLWSKSRNDPKLSYMPKAIMGLLNLLDSTKPDVIYRSMANIISSTIRARNKIREKKGPNDTVPSVTIHETTVLDFAKRFTADLTLSKGETDRLLQSWIDIQLLVKEGMTSRSPLSFVLLLRMVHVFVSRVSANLGNEEKKTKKELQDTALKLVEINLKISTDSCASNDPELKPNETIDSENFKSLLSKKYAISLKALATVSNVVPGLFGVLFPDRERALSYILPQIFTFLRDHKETNLPWVHLAVRFLANLMKAGFPTKSWKKDALDLFYDNCFFLIDFNTISEWKSLIHEIMVSDRTNFENLMRVASKSFQAHQPAMMFVSKEQENILRARNIKRIAFVLYCSEFDYYVNQLPAILERIVEAIKSSPSSLIVQQIFLLMRVILLRITPKKLTNFWPVIMHELMRSLTFNPKSPQYDKVMLSAIKFVDMAQLIPCEQLKLFEWIFVRDHFEAVSSPIPLYESYLDSIANATPIRSEGRLVPPSKARRPLVALRDLSTFEQLASTMQYYSDFSYQACVTGGALDTAMVERIVEADFVEYEKVDGFASSPAQLILMSQSSGESSEAKEEQEVFDYGRLEDNNDGGPDLNESEISDLPQDYNVMAIPDFGPRESGDLSLASSSSSSSLSLSPSFSSSSIAIGSQTSSSSSSSSNGDHF